MGDKRKCFDSDDLRVCEVRVCDLPTTCVDTLCRCNDRILSLPPDDTFIKRIRGALHSHVCEYSSIKTSYFSCLLRLLYSIFCTVSCVTRELQIHTKRTCQISNRAFIIVGVPASVNDTINFTETCKYRVLI